MTEILLVEHPGRNTAPLMQALATMGAAFKVTRIEGHRPALEQLERRQPDILIAAAHTGDPLTECGWLFARAVMAAPAAIRLAIVDLEASTSALPPEVPFAHQCLPSQPAGKADAPSHVGFGIAVAAAVEVARASRANPALQRLLGSIEALPSPPALYFDIREQLQARSGTIANMSAISRRDPALVARVLKVANSGFFGLPRSVSDITDAIALIGGDALLALVLSTHLYHGLPPPGLNLDLLWRHAADVSACARVVARNLGCTSAQQTSAATAGLLHDIGLLVLLRSEPSRYQPLWRRSAGNERTLVQLERESFGVSHDELGAAVLTLWTLPADVVSAVRASHATDASGTALVARAVLAAEWLQHDDFSADDATLPQGLLDIGAGLPGGWPALRAAVDAAQPCP